MTIDHRDLLKRYVRLVEAVEGSNFIGHMSRPPIGLAFTPAEIAELDAVAAEGEIESERAIAEYQAAKGKPA